MTYSVLVLTEVWTTLQSLCGVGAKVADCVAMMSLDKLEAVPIDTHMWSVATRDYGFEKKSKTLTARIYKRIGEYIVNLNGFEKRDNFVHY